MASGSLAGGGIVEKRAEASEPVVAGGVERGDER